MRTGTVLTLVACIVFTGAAGLAGFMLSSSSGPHTPAEQLIADNLYAGSSGMYHVADLQARPGVTAALGRLRAANVCDLFYRVRTHKMNDNVMMARLCGKPTDRDLSPVERGEFKFQAEQLHPAMPPPAGFAVFSAADGTAYLVAHGKNGTTDADEMEKIVTTVIDNAIANLPAAIAEGTREADASKAQQAARDEAARKVKASFQ